MQGRRFLELARRWVGQVQEETRRAVVGRAYYALMLECRDFLDGLAFRPSRTDNVHTFVRLRFLFSSDPDISSIGRYLDNLGTARNRADYEMQAREFHKSGTAQDAVANSQTALTLLDTIAADAIRVAAIQADIGARWP